MTLDVNKRLTWFVLGMNFGVLMAACIFVACYYFYGP